MHYMTKAIPLLPLPPQPSPTPTPDPPPTPLCVPLSPFTRSVFSPPHPLPHLPLLPHYPITLTPPPPPLPLPPSSRADLCTALLDGLEGAGHSGRLRCLFEAPLIDADLGAKTASVEGLGVVPFDLLVCVCPRPALGLPHSLSWCSPRPLCCVLATLPMLRAHHNAKALCAACSPHCYAHSWRATPPRPTGQTGPPTTCPHDVLVQRVHRPPLCCLSRRSLRPFFFPSTSRRRSLRTPRRVQVLGALRHHPCRVPGKQGRGCMKSNGALERGWGRAGKRACVCGGRRRLRRRGACASVRATKGWDRDGTGMGPCGQADAPRCTCCGRIGTCQWFARMRAGGFSLVYGGRGLSGTLPPMIATLIVSGGEGLGRPRRLNPRV